MDDIAVINNRIARNLSQVRAARGLTFDQLAKKSAVSKGMLVQIEQGRTNPSIATLCRIANALGVTVSRFVEGSEEPTARLIPASEAIELWQGRRGSSGKLLVGFETPSLLEVWDWDLVPGEWYDGVAHPAGTREVLYVQEGELTLSTDGAHHKAGATDVLMFQADRPHRYANEGSKRLRFLMVVTEPAHTPGARGRRSRPGRED
jgi:transcriptional regulator with XRE-family HTH domain